MAGSVTERQSAAPDIEPLAREHVESYNEDQFAQHKASTALVRFKSLQQLWKLCVDEGEIHSSPGIATTPPAVLKPSEVKALLATCVSVAVEDRRDAAIVTPLYDAGLSLSELVNLKLSSMEVEGSMWTLIDASCSSSERGTA